MPEQAAAAPKRRYEMPFLLMVGMGLTAFFSSVWVLASVLMIIMLPFGGTYTFNGQPVAKGDFLKVAALPVLAVGAAGVLLASIAYALWAERPISRTLMMVFWAVIGLISAISLAWDGEVGAMLGVVAEIGVTTAVAYWYLYAKPNVKAYFATLEAAVQRSVSEHSSASAPSGA